jgi:leucyl-tRNA synthetase
LYVVVRYKYFQILVIHGVVLEGKARPKKKKHKMSKSKRSKVSTSKIIDNLDFSSDEIVRLKITVRKGARIESVPLKKLERLATKTRRYWKFENGWLILLGLP